MTRVDKFFLWLGRIALLPLAGTCFFIVWQVYRNMLNIGADKFVLDSTIFLLCGTYCLAYFIALLRVKADKKEESK